MAKISGANTRISGRVGQLLYRQTKRGTIISELPAKPITPLRTQRQMNVRAQWSNLGAIYKQFDSMLRRGFEDLPSGMNVYNAFIQANLGVVKVYITKTMRLNGGAVLAPYQITRGSLPSISMAVNSGNILVSGIRLGSLSISAVTTVAQFSQAVIDNNDAFGEGDQLTFFHGIQTIDAVTRVPRASIKGYKVVLDTADDTPLWDLVSPMGFSVADNCLATASQITNGAAVWVHSRESGNGTLKVSTQFFYVENSALAAYQNNSAALASANSYGGVNSAAVYLQPEIPIAD
ncbi:MAG: hypothetical protein KBT45_01805 [Bacteroidales bacterium]|nr:hypothetical protein [Candidatus Colimorpha pelethequi]